MHSPGHSSADSMVASTSSGWTVAVPSAIFRAGSPFGAPSGP